MNNYQGGNAGDIGLSSELVLMLVFGVGGVTPVAETLPMNQDCKGGKLITGYTVEGKEAYRNPTAISTYLFDGLYHLLKSVSTFKTAGHSRRTSGYTS